MPRIFVSYRREDSIDATGRICDRLKEHFGREAVFLDVDAVPFGVDFRLHIEQEVGRCDVLLAIIGKGWIEARHEEEGSRRRLDDPGDFVRVEIASASSGAFRSSRYSSVLRRCGVPHEKWTVG